MTEQKLKVYCFYTKIRNKKTNKIAKKQFIIVAYGFKEAKELFEIIIENWKKQELIEISEIKRDSRKKWDSSYIRHYYEMLMAFKKRAQEEE